MQEAGRWADCCLSLPVCPVLCLQRGRYGGMGVVKGNYMGQLIEGKKQQVREECRGG